MNVVINLIILGYNLARDPDCPIGVEAKVKARVSQRQNKTIKVRIAQLCKRRLTGMADCFYRRSNRQAYI